MPSVPTEHTRLPFKLCTEFTTGACPARCTAKCCVFSEVADEQSASQSTKHSADPSPQSVVLQNVSNSCRSLLVKMQRDPPVDLILATPKLTSMSDVEAVLMQADQQDSVRSLSVGPWGTSCFSTCCAGGGSISTVCTSADSLVQVVQRTAPVWSKWQLRSFCVCDLALRNVLALAQVLEMLPESLQAVHLCRMHLGVEGRLRDCLAALGLCKFRKLNRIRLDVAENNLQDSDADMLLPLLMPTNQWDSGVTATDKTYSELQGSSICASDRSGTFSQETKPVVTKLVVSGNPLVTASSVSRILGFAGTRLEELDVSECNLGSAGGYVISECLRKPDCVLRSLSAYRTGLGSSGVLMIISSAVQSSSLQLLNLVANGQHESRWLESVGQSVASELQNPAGRLRVLAMSCPERQISQARNLFQDTRARVILVPNEQNNYNRSLFQGHVH